MASKKRLKDVGSESLLVAPIRASMIAEDEQQKALIEQVMTGLAPLEDAFEKCCKGGMFFGGENIGLLDIALGSLLGAMKPLDETQFPRLAAWSKAFCEAESVKELMPKSEKLAEFANVLRERMKR